MMIKLTEYSIGGGCGCKIEPGVLGEILKNNLADEIYSNLLVGNKTRDDAAVWELENGTAVINTVDFFMPIVNDAFDFGRIAAVNAISDIYAMGGKPLFANSILAWPMDRLPASEASKVLKGASAVCKMAGIPLAGGHSIKCSEPIFGLSVTGLVDKTNIKKNNTAHDGDLIYLTKSIGTGIISTANKKSDIDEAILNQAINSMCLLNSIGELLGKISEVSAMTDVTGFALLGHLLEMAEGSNLSAQINLDKIKLFNGLSELIDKNYIPGNTLKNWESYKSKISPIEDLTIVKTLCDPQTSGGLLIAVNPSAKSKIEALFYENGLSEYSKPIGYFSKKTNFDIIVNY